MSVWYNENDRHAAGWLRNLISAGLIPAGDVDTRDIRDVCAGDLAGYTQCHFFAGIGIWPLALRMAGWPSERRIWTGTCPCQRFSQAGKGDGFADDRHLWPAWHWLIRECRPVALAGEQVESVDGRAWLDVVSADLERCGYACGAAVLPSAGVGAPNLRHRLFWVADADRDGCDEQQRVSGKPASPGVVGQRKSAYRSGAVGLADAEGRGRREHRVLGEAAGRREDAGQSALSDEVAGRLGDACGSGLSDAEPPRAGGSGRRQKGRAVEQSGGAPDPWRELEWIACRDGRLRPTQPGLFPLAPRHPGDVAELRAIGNAINPWVAAEVIQAWMTCRS